MEYIKFEKYKKYGKYKKYKIIKYKIKIVYNSINFTF